MSTSRKGKEREREPADGAGVGIHIRFSDAQVPDLNMFVTEFEVVRDVKRRMRLLRPRLDQRRLRLIYLGRLLTNGTKLVPYLAQLLKHQREQDNSHIIDDALEGIGDVVKSVSAATGLDDSQQNPSSKGKDKAVDKDLSHLSSVPIWLHCSVGEVGTADDEQEVVQNTQLKPLQGLDRLQDAGFSQEEIDNLRRQFHQDSHVGSYQADEDEHARALEEAWMESSGQDGPMLDANSSGYITLFIGVSSGFFFPFLPIFFFKQDVFSSKMEMAIVAGVAVNLIFGALRTFS